MEFKDKKVLVAGGTGLVGTNMVKRLATLEAKPRATFHEKEPKVFDDRIEYVRCDLTRPEDCQRAVEGIDYLFMCAAVIAGAGKIATTPLFNVTPNAVMNCLMLEAAYNAGVKKYLTFGSSTAYPDFPYPLKEEEMFDGEPYDKYFFIGWVMRFKEKLCEMYSTRLKEPMPVIVLRPTNIYGPHDNYDLATSHVTPALIRKVVERHDPIEVWGRGEEIRDLLYVDDVVDAALLAMERMDRYDPINIGLGKGYSVKKILQTICEVENYHPRIVFDETKPTTIPVRYLDISKAERVLGWKPKTDLKEGLRKTIEWYRETMA